MACRMEKHPLTLCKIYQNFPHDKKLMLVITIFGPNIFEYFWAVQSPDISGYVRILFVPRLEFGKMNFVVVVQLAGNCQQ